MYERTFGSHGAKKVSSCRRNKRADNFKIGGTEVNQYYWKEENDKIKIQLSELQEKYDELEQQIKGNCKWKYDEYYNMYETDCEHAFIFIEGRKSDNGFLFCPYCGKKIEEVLKQEERDE